MCIIIFFFVFAGSFGIPFVTASFKSCIDIQKLVAIDNHCDVCTPNHVVKRASTRQVFKY